MNQPPAAGTRQNAPLMLLTWLAAAAATLTLIFFVDVPITWFLHHNVPTMPPWLHSIFQSARFYGQGLCLAFVIAFMLLVRPERRRDTVLLVVAVLIVAAVTNLLKATTGRARPDQWLNSRIMWDFASGFASQAHASLPSAHAASAFALSAALARNYPRGRLVLFAVAALCALSRMIDMRHYLSDVIAGAAIGTWFGYGVYRWRSTAAVADLLQRTLPFLRDSHTP